MLPIEVLEAGLLPRRILSRKNWLSMLSGEDIMTEASQVFTCSMGLPSGSLNSGSYR